MITAKFIILSVLTLNIWGLPGGKNLGLAPFRNSRIQGICKELKKATWDAVFLQEVWQKEDRKKLSTCGYPFALDSNDTNAIIDSGLLILSRYPLKEAQRLTYPPLDLDSSVLEEGEALARKSADLVRLEHPDVGSIWLANTHLVSYYGEGALDKYHEVRRQQFVSFVNWVKSVVKDDPVIVGGDWNFGAHNLELWREKDLGLVDFRASKESEELTTLSKDNLFQKEDQGRVDHLFASRHFDAIQGCLSMQNPVSYLGFPINLSDHFGWTENFRLKTKKGLQRESLSTLLLQTDIVAVGACKVGNGKFNH